ncbi:hypothetical protein NEUTE2DRAFT_122822 [Neurospora tetrasperma FGSC 2509]|nr:hypothetical protein NEUTE2DRAFT_122822 [Neurospora tetrasperma FGSC 2509]
MFPSLVYVALNLAVPKTSGLQKWNITKHTIDSIREFFAWKDQQPPAKIIKLSTVPDQPRRSRRTNNAASGSSSANPTSSTAAPDKETIMIISDDEKASPEPDANPTSSSAVPPSVG